MTQRSRTAWPSWNPVRKILRTPVIPGDKFQRIPGGWGGLRRPSFPWQLRTPLLLFCQPRPAENRQVGGHHCPKPSFLSWVDAGVQRVPVGSLKPTSALSQASGPVQALAARVGRVKTSRLGWFLSRLASLGQHLALLQPQPAFNPPLPSFLLHPKYI